MEGGPAPNSYTIPTTIGFARHTLTKCRLPSITIGRKRANSPGYGHGLLYNLRDQTRFGRLYRPDFGLGTRRPLPQEHLPAPNTYYPKMDSVRPKAPKASFKSRTLQFGRIDDCYPSPNTYTLPLSDVYRRSKKSACVKITEPRFKVVSEAVPAPNTYSLPSTGIYKYGQTVHSTILLKRPENIESLAPPPNRYYLPKTKGPAKTFGRKDSHKRSVYLTVDDLWE
ncbi:outer dense fiber protein 3-like protein 2 [Aphis gossypii]|uniref:Uncharacterized protein n=1 Tax=Aphis gossypii TaxID=80765 RepID=A0A9P0NCA9_APHGO|nr:outer dense fiber protein 3-like protein 2 [Aphis gossypii]CAH1709646.1 unnamed protein product [Aphis gossypii]